MIYFSDMKNIFKPSKYQYSIQNRTQVDQVQTTNECPKIDLGLNVTLVLYI